MSKDDRIAELEAEIRAARETIKELTRAISELAKNAGKTTIIDRSYPYYVKPYPYWWDGNKWYYSTTYGGSNTLTTGGVAHDYTININKGDDDGGCAVSNVA